MFGLSTHMEKVILSKPIDFLSLYLISSNINIHSAGVALFESIDGLNLEADFHYAKCQRVD